MTEENNIETEWCDCYSPRINDAKHFIWWLIMSVVFIYTRSYHDDAITMIVSPMFLGVVFCFLCFSDRRFRSGNYKFEMASLHDTKFHIIIYMLFASVMCFVFLSRGVKIKPYLMLYGFVAVLFSYLIVITHYYYLEGREVTIADYKKTVAPTSWRDKIVVIAKMIVVLFLFVISLSRMLAHLRYRQPEILMMSFYHVLIPYVLALICVCFKGQRLTIKNHYTEFAYNQVKLPTYNTVLIVALLVGLQFVFEDTTRTAYTVVLPLFLFFRLTVVHIRYSNWFGLLGPFILLLFSMVLLGGYGEREHLCGFGM